MTDGPRFATRQAEHPVDEIFLRRWSSRAMSGEALTRTEVATVLEAARWAPSAYNEQPWRFLYVFPDSPLWTTYVDTLFEVQRQWVARAGALALILSRRTYERSGKPSRAYSFDAGAACQNACLKAAAMGLVSHVVQGFDDLALRRALAVPDVFSVEFILVLGRPGDPELLPAALQVREMPTPRRRVDEFAFEGLLPVEAGGQPLPAAEDDRLQHTTEGASHDTIDA